MLGKKSTIMIWQNFSRSLGSVRQMCTKDLRVCLEEKMKAMYQQEQQHKFLANKVSIWHVPENLREVKPRAYDPHFISIGPYNHGSSNLQGSERLKWLSLNRLVDSGEQTGVELHNLIAALQDIEDDARACYSEDIKLSKDEFVKMMLLDGCFIIDLFRDLKLNNFACSSLLSKRWMLSVVRRDLITLENQLPMIVLRKLFAMTRRKSTPEPLLEELALRFFDPLMPRSPDILRQSIKSTIEGSQQHNFKHLLDLFHSSISLRKVKRCKEPHMYWSVSELKEVGVKVRVLGNSQPLELKFERGVLKMPRLQINDHTDSFFRNLVAYEQCRQGCKPDVTTYLFFLDKLINSADDVALLHYEGVIQHSLGSNKEVAKLVNSLCVEVEHDGQGSYLCEVVKLINSYSDRTWVQAKTRLKHDYFTNLWVGISTIAAFLLLYLTLLQASYDVMCAQEKHHENKDGWWASLNLFLIDPVTGFKKFFGLDSRCTAADTASRDPPPNGPQ